MTRTRSTLLSRIKSLDDGTAWEEFDRLYRPLLVQYALERGLSPEEAEEIAQHCLGAIAQGIRGFRRRVSFRGYLRGMIEHKVSDRLKARRKEHGARTVDFDREQTRETNPALLWEREWNKTHLLYCLNQMKNEVSPLTYQAFELYVIHELPVSQIADRLGMTPNQVYGAKHRVMARLKERWRELVDRPV